MYQVDMNRRYRGACYLHRRDDESSETSIFNKLQGETNQTVSIFILVPRESQIQITTINFVSQQHPNDRESKTIFFLIKHKTVRSRVAQSV
jgi:hypothetical protein